MTLVVTAAVAPLRAEPSVRAEQVTQLLLGETADVLETQGAWRRIRTHDVGYEGWVHAGYTGTDSSAAAWREQAVWRAEGGVVLECEPGHARFALPLGARIVVAREAILLPDGRRARCTEGMVRTAAEIASEARRIPPYEWALDHFGGAPYEWGGRTPWGVDCSGLVQAAYAARGIQLPRDSGQQATSGEPVADAAMRAGDLLFFRSDSGRDVITHVAFLADEDTLVHSTLDCGGVLRESWAPGTRAAALRPRLAAVRRV